MNFNITAMFLVKVKILLVQLKIGQLWPQRNATDWYWGPILIVTTLVKDTFPNHEQTSLINWLNGIDLMAIHLVWTHWGGGGSENFENVAYAFTFFLYIATIFCILGKVSNYLCFGAYVLNGQPLTNKAITLQLEITHK